LPGENKNEHIFGQVRKKGIVKRKEKREKLGKQIQALEAQQDNGDKLLIANSKEIAELDACLEAVEPQIEFAEGTAADEDIGSLIHKAVEAIRDEFQIHTSEDIDATLDDNSCDLLNDLKAGCVEFSEHCQGPAEIMTEKKAGCSLNDRKTVIAQILKIDWKPKGEAGVSVAPQSVLRVQTRTQVMIRLKMTSKI
jgi:hypothetical protein